MTRFVGWLTGQAGRDEWIGRLGAATGGDRGIPADATPDQLRERMLKLGADPDLLEALDDAEREWAVTA